MPLGSDLVKSTDCRMVFATLRSLAELMNDDRFRRDLLFRLQGHHVEIPSLRQRIDDLPLLLDHFFAEAAAILKRNKPAYPPQLIDLLSTYDFPGNIRELRNMVIDAVSRQESTTISMEHFKKQIMALRHNEEPVPADQGPSSPTPFSPIKRLPSLKQASRLLIKEALQRTNGNQKLAAEMLGITRQALNWRLNQPDDQDKGAETAR